MDNLAYQEETWEEMIGGKIVAMAPASTNHNRVKQNISAIFYNFLKNRTCEVLPDGEAVYLTEDDYYIPDVMVVCDPEKIREDGVYGPPDLVVEVLSPGSAKYDHGRKKDIYEKCGVKEYWIVDPANKIINQYLIKDGRFTLHDTYVIYPGWMLARMKPEERAAIAVEFRCSLYDDLVIRLEDVFYRVK